MSGNNGGVFISIRHLVKKFGTFTALDDISFDIEEGAFVCFLGPSGCGKTTMLRAIAGLDIQTSGAIVQAGRNISNLPPSERDFGIVFQSYALFPNLTVQQNVAYGLENAGKSKTEVTGRVTELLQLVGLPDQGAKYPAQLSGGQQQRIALARALATSPGLLLLDEPLSALDARVRVHLRHEIKQLQQRLGVTTIMVTHDQEEALSMADVIVVMNHGVIDQIGTPEEIYRKPASLFVANFIGEMNQMPGKVIADDSVALGDLKLACQSHNLPKNAEAVVAIRPEDIVPQSNASKAQKNCITANIEDMEFLGSFSRVEIGGGALEDTTLTADLSVNAVKRLNAKPGAKIKIELPQDRLLVFPANGGA
ncbi:MAG: putative 2-aminoethylphosphonate ABC transporter ATP-binding protein [Hyphomicrobiales bacterium]